MKVKLLNEDAALSSVRIAIEAALTCTGNEADIDSKEERAFLLKIIDKGHESVLEHINLTFRVDGISRALLQELARHRHISLSVRSTRFTLLKSLSSDDGQKVPLKKTLRDVESILYNGAHSLGDDAQVINEGIPIIAQMTYDVASLLTALSSIPKISPLSVPDFLKYFLPECLPTSLVMTCNARELRHIFKLRSKPEAFLEFRRLVNALFKALPTPMRYLFCDVLDVGVLSLPTSDFYNDDDADTSYCHEK